MKAQELKKHLDGKYQYYIVIGKLKESEDGHLYLNSHEINIASLFEDAFEKYPPLKGILKDILQ